MKVIQVNVVYPYGSTGKIVYDIHNELVLNKIDSLVLCGRSESKCEEILYSVGKTYSRFQSLLERIHGLSYGGCFFSTKRIITLIKKNKPDVVHLHCLNGNFVNIYKLISWLKKEKSSKSAKFINCASSKDNLLQYIVNQILNSPLYS